MKVSCNSLLQCSNDHSKNVTTNVVINGSTTLWMNLPPRVFLLILSTYYICSCFFHIELKNYTFTCQYRHFWNGQLIRPELPVHHSPKKLKNNQQQIIGQQKRSWTKHRAHFRVQCEWQIRGIINETQREIDTFHTKLYHKMRLYLDTGEHSRVSVAERNTHSVSQTSHSPLVGGGSDRLMVTQLSTFLCVW